MRRSASSHIRGPQAAIDLPATAVKSLSSTTLLPRVNKAALRDLQSGWTHALSDV